MEIEAYLARNRGRKREWKEGKNAIGSVIAPGNPMTVEEFAAIPFAKLHPASRNDRHHNDARLTPLQLAATKERVRRSLARRGHSRELVMRLTRVLAVRSASRISLTHVPLLMPNRGRSFAARRPCISLWTRVSE